LRGALIENGLFKGRTGFHNSPWGANSVGDGGILGAEQEKCKGGPVVLIVVQCGVVKPRTNTSKGVQDAMTIGVIKKPTKSGWKNRGVYLQGLGVSRLATKKTRM